MDASGRWTGKRRKFVYMTDDNFLPISGCFHEIYLPKSERILVWVLRKCSSSKLHIKRCGLSSCPCTGGQAPPPTDPFLLRQVCFSRAWKQERPGSFSGQEALGTHKVVLLWERKAGWSMKWTSLGIYFVVIRSEFGREERGVIVFTF